MITNEIVYGQCAPAVTMAVPVTFLGTGIAPAASTSRGRLLAVRNAPITGGVRLADGWNAEFVTRVASQPKDRVLTGRAWSPPI